MKIKSIETGHDYYSMAKNIGLALFYQKTKNDPYYNSVDKFVREDEY